MEAPKCKLCGERHYGLCAPEPPGKFALPLPQGPQSKWAPAETSRVAAEQSRQMFDRTAYQREYMRKRRAKEKEAKDG